MSALYQLYQASQLYWWRKLLQNNKYHIVVSYALPFVLGDESSMQFSQRTERKKVSH